MCFSNITILETLFKCHISQSNILSNAEQILPKVAEQIDKAENIALEKLDETYQNEQKILDDIKQQKEIKIQNEQEKQQHIDEQIEQNNQIRIEAETWKKLYEIDNNWAYCFTQATNSLSLPKVLWLLADNQGIFKIDYSACTNTRIKNKVQKEIGWMSCWITFDKNRQKYFLRDKLGNLTTQKAFAWEWVKVTKEEKCSPTEEDIQVLTAIKQEKQENFSFTSIAELPEFSENKMQDLRTEITKQTQRPEFDPKDKPYICADYAYSIISEVLAKQGRVFTNVNKNVLWASSAWEITERLKRYAWNQFEIKEATPGNDLSSQDILNAPAWSILSLHSYSQAARDHGASHLIVSLGNGIYTDLVWDSKRTFQLTEKDFDTNHQVKLNGKWMSFSSHVNDDPSKKVYPALTIPKIDTLTRGEKRKFFFEWGNINGFLNDIQRETWLPQNYIRMKLAQQNYLTIEETYKNISNPLTVALIAQKKKEEVITETTSNAKREYSEYNPDIIPNNDVTKKYIEWLKEFKMDLMQFYPRLKNDQYDKIAQRALGILWKESAAGEADSYWSLVWWKEWWCVGVGTAIINTVQNRERSRGYTQIKFDTLFWKGENSESQAKLQFIKTTFSYHNPDDLNDPKICAWVTMMGLIQNYHDFILPMKQDRYRRENVQIRRIIFNDTRGVFDSWFNVIEWYRKYWKHFFVEIAESREFNINGEKRVRTSDEIQAKIDERSKQHGWIFSETNIERPWITNDDDFYDFLYYTRNNPSEIFYWTANVKENGYTKVANEFLASLTSKTKNPDAQLAAAF